MEQSECARFKFSQKEHKIAALVARGYTTPEIASTLGMAKNTVKKHLTKMYLRTGVWQCGDNKRLAFVKKLGYTSNDDTPIAANAINSLTPKEFQVAQLYASTTMKTKCIANSMNTTVPMIKKRLAAIFDKLGVWNRIELAIRYNNCFKEFKETK